jgi:hypothetical protein
MESAPRPLAVLHPVQLLAMSLDGGSDRPA